MNINNWTCTNAVDIRSLEYPLFRTFIISKLSFSTLGNRPYKFVRYLELRYLELLLLLSLQRFLGLFSVNYLKPFHFTQKPRFRMFFFSSFFSSFFWYLELFFTGPTENGDRGCQLYLSFRSSHRRCSTEKSVSKNFANLVPKQLCWSFYFNKVAVVSVQHWRFCVNCVEFLSIAKLIEKSIALPSYVLDRYIKFVYLDLGWGCMWNFDITDRTDKEIHR